MRRLLCHFIGALALCTGLVACGGGSGAVNPGSDTAAPVRNLATVEALASGPVTIHMLGDSTMTRYAEDRRPQMGWGEALPQFFNASVKVNNWALGGRSSRSFFYEATRWPAILPQIQAGDYVIIQFGHNDQKSGGDYAQYGTYAFCSDGTSDGEACTGRPDRVDPAVDISQHSYYQWLKKYVGDTRSRGGIPILMAPIVRKYFSGTTITPQGQHHLGIIGGESYARGDFVAAMKAVAATYQVPFVDLTAETRKIVESYGNAAATANLYIAADSTHPQVLFANLIAKRAVEGMKALNILSGYMVPVTSLIASPATLDWSTRYVNMPSSKTLTLSAFDLMPREGALTVSAPANFKLSLDGGGTWSQQVDIAYANGAFIKTLPVQFNPTQAISYNGNLSFAIAGAPLATTVAVSGTGVSTNGGIASHATWYTQGTSLASLADGLVTSSNASVHKLAASTSKVLAVDGQDTTVARYVANSPARDNTQYLKFAVAPASGSFSVDMISAYLTSSGGSTVVADIEYSLNADFSAATRLNTSPLSFVKESMTKVSYPVVVQVPAGATLYVRILPWNSAGVIGKTLAVYGVKVSGTATSAAPASVDVTSSFALMRSGLSWNRITNQYSAAITLTNTSGATLSGPFRLTFDRLTPGVTLDNSSGVRDGVPYITLNGAPIGAGAKVTVALTFSNPNKAAIGYTNAVFTDPL